VAVSQNRIAWTTTIAQAFPQLANIRAEYRDVTLRELLSHQSGVKANITSEAAFGSGTTVVDQRASVTAWAVEQPPAGARGAFLYSNLGYIIAAAMLDRALGTSFEAAMSAQVFGPLGMTTAGWGPQAAAGSTTQPVAHRWTNGSWLELENLDNPPVYGSAGRAHMSLTSWAHFVREVLRVEAGTSTIVPAAIGREMTVGLVPAPIPQTTYGLGWHVSTRVWANGKVLFHDGSNTGNMSMAYLAPVRNVAILVTTNGWDPNPNGSANLSVQALNQLYGRLITYHNTGK
jgi:CubicO group peptidase (beta-lactamase class C family)